VNNQTNSLSPPSRVYLGYALALLWLVNVTNYVDRSIVGVLIEPMRADLHLTDTQIGIMTGFAFALFYAIGGLYLAHLADTRSRPSLIAVSILVWSLMTAFTGAAHNFWQLLMARVGVGMGEAGVIPAANALLADSYKPERRPLALAVFTSGSMIGIMVGSVVGGFLAAGFGWRCAFIATGLAGLPLALITRLTLRDVPRGGSDGTKQTSAPGFAAAMRQILRNQPLVLLVLSYAFLVFMLFGVVTWFPALIVRTHGLGIAQVGTQFGLAMGLGTAVGGILGGTVANRLAAKDLTWLSRMPLISMCLLWPLYQAAIFTPLPKVSLAFVALAAAVGGMALGPALAAMQMALPASIRAKGAAFNGFVGSLIGIGGAPLLVGAVSDHFTPELGPALALQRGLAVAVTAGSAGAALMWLAHRRFSDFIRTSSNPDAVLQPHPSHEPSQLQ